MKYWSTILSTPLAIFLWSTASAQTTPKTVEPASTPTITAPVVSAEPDWQICNETSFALRIATATMIEDKLQPRGWSKLAAGACLAQDARAETPRFVYAESSPAHRGGIREWKGNSLLCAGDEDFVADTTIGCALQNLATRPYLAVDPAEKITTLVEIDDFGSKASIAGIQRLLQDNGYEITRVDGVAGLRTSRTLGKFLKDQELPTSLTSQEQLAALEKAATEKVKAVGLTICNKSSAGIWGAIGNRRNGNWESKGWWEIKPETCGQVFTESLISSDVSFYALQNGRIDEEGAKSDERILRSIAATPSQFCVADSRFSVLGRENCADLGYQAANFRVLPIDKEGLTVELTDADFAEPSASGLR